MKRQRAISRDEARLRDTEMFAKAEVAKALQYEHIMRTASDMYAGIDPRRRQEVADSGMVREDRTAMANLSNTPVHREYVQSAFYCNPFIDDSVLE